MSLRSPAPPVHPSPMSVPSQFGNGHGGGGTPQHGGGHGGQHHFNHPPPSTFFAPDDVMSVETERDNVGVGGLPSEAQLVLLCLDYLRDLRRAYPTRKDLDAAEGLDARWITVACHALGRAFVRPDQLRHFDDVGGGNGRGGDEVEKEFGKGNDAWFDPEINRNALDDRQFTTQWRKDRHGGGGSVTSGGDDRSGAGGPENARRLARDMALPSLEEMDHELLYLTDPQAQQRGGGGKSGSGPDKAAGGNAGALTTTTPSDPSSWYKYDDAHPSNSHRFYHLNGLAGGTLPESGGPLSPAAAAHRGPLSLGEVAAAGLAGLAARTRLDAEREMVRTPLFEQFLRAVEGKGFFADLEQPPTPSAEEQANMTDEARRLAASERAQADTMYEDRYRKVVGKFRTKLAAKAAGQAQFSTPGGLAVGSPGPTPLAATPRGMGGMSMGGDGGSVASAGDASMMSGSVLAATAAERQRRRRDKRIAKAKFKSGEGAVGGGGTGNAVMAPTDVANRALGGAASPHSNVTGGGNLKSITSSEATPPSSNLSLAGNTPTPAAIKAAAGAPLTPRTPTIAEDRAVVVGANIAIDPARDGVTSYNPTDLEEADRHKTAGNALMQKKDYPRAVDSYTAALKLVPSGPTSHVYYSNRAAALLSLQRFGDALSDAERALALKPEYAKAHARRGLAYFLLGNFAEAAASYERAVELEPDNKAHRGYLEKARRKRRAQVKMERERELRDGKMDQAGKDAERRMRARKARDDRATRGEHGKQEEGHHERGQNQDREAASKAAEPVQAQGEAAEENRPPEMEHGGNAVQAEAQNRGEVYSDTVKVDGAPAHSQQAAPQAFDISPAASQAQPQPQPQGYDQTPTAPQQQPQASPARPQACGELPPSPARQQPPFERPAVKAAPQAYEEPQPHGQPPLNLTGENRLEHGDGGSGPDAQNRGGVYPDAPQAAQPTHQQGVVQLPATAPQVQPRPREHDQRPAAPQQGPRAYGGPEASPVGPQAYGEPQPSLAPQQPPFDRPVKAAPQAYEEPPQTYDESRARNRGDVVFPVTSTEHIVYPADHGGDRDDDDDDSDATGGTEPLLGTSHRQHQESEGEDPQQHTTPQQEEVAQHEQPPQQQPQQEEEVDPELTRRAVREADRLKARGNAKMSQRDYLGAIDSYTAALNLNPAGPSSHVYFSNRAAALCYLERYEEAELDSERSLALRPDYGKAHARLGLSRYFLGDYAAAIEAYENALRHDPDNAAGRSYLEKARRRLEAEESGTVFSSSVAGESCATTEGGSVAVAPPVIAQGGGDSEPMASADAEMTATAQQPQASPFAASTYDHVREEDVGDGGGESAIEVELDGHAIEEELAGINVSGDGR